MLTSESYQINIKFHSKNNYHHLCMSLQCYDSHSVITGGREQQDEKSETSAKNKKFQIQSDHKRLSKTVYICTNDDNNKKNLYLGDAKTFHWLPPE
jgi:hypothetical protein